MKRKTIRARIVAVSVVAASLMMAGCSAAGAAGGGSDSSKGVIGVIPQSTLFTYWTTVESGAKEAAAKYGYSIAYQGTATDTDSEGQAKIVQDFVTKGVKAIVIAPVNKDALVPALQRASDAGIPVIIIDGVLSADFPASTVSTDNEAAGAIAAEHMEKLIGDSGKVAVVNAVAGAAATSARENGFRKKLGELGNYTLLNTYFSEGDANKAKSIAQDILESNPDIKGIFTTNEGATNGVSLAVKNKGQGGEVHVIGFDSSDQILASITAGDIDGTVTQDPAKEGFLGVENAVKTLQKKTVEKKVPVPALYVDKSNINDPSVQKILHPAGSK